MKKAVIHSNNMSVPMKAVLLIIAVIILSGVLIGYREYNKPARSVANEVAITITASQLFNEFEANEAVANKKYLNKAVLVTGSVSEISFNQSGKTVIILESDNPMFGVSCTMEEKPQNLAIGIKVSVKGICTGYLSDVVVTRGIISK